MHENAIACHGSIYIFIECVRAWQHDKLPWISILAFLAINRQFCVCTVYTVKAHIFVFLFPFLFPKLYSIYIYFDSSYGVCLVDICLNRRTAIKLRSRTDWVITLLKMINLASCHVHWQFEFGFIMKSFWLDLFFRTLNYGSIKSVSSQP